MEKNIREMWYLWGGLWGAVVGLIAAKTYQTWAFLFYTQGRNFWGFDGWSTAPLWMWATENNQLFVGITLVIFIFLGVMFVRFLINNKVIK